MNDLHTLFEYSVSRGFDWTDAEASIFDRFNTEQRANIITPIIRAGRREIRSSQFVGLLATSERSVQILPKIWSGAGLNQDEDKRVREASENLLLLLSYVGHLKSFESEIASLSEHTSNWFEILTRLFASNLHRELQRGAMRSYESIADSLPVLKGKWQIASQLRKPWLRHRFEVVFDEFTADNQINRVFRFVVEKLSRVSRDEKNIRLLNDLKFMMDEVTLLPAVSHRDANPTLLNRLNSRYAGLLNLARLFLMGRVSGLSGGRTSSYAFVFDMNILFEEFIAGFVEKNRASILPAPLEDTEILPQSKGVSRHLAERNGTRLFMLKPDIVFRGIGDEIPFIVDTKYKVLDSEDTKFGVSQADMYQMHAYSERYECPRILLLYPEGFSGAKKPRERFGILGTGNRVSLATVNLNRRLSLGEEQEALIEELREIFAFSADEN
ncbi:MAG: hypothetical protein R2684_14140 [Pyrinomonadaceae bacterium]